MSHRDGAKRLTGCRPDCVNCPPLPTKQQGQEEAEEGEEGEAQGGEGAREEVEEGDEEAEQEARRTSLRCHLGRSRSTLPPAPRVPPERRVGVMRPAGNEHRSTLQAQTPAELTRKRFEGHLAPRTLRERHANAGPPR